MVPLPEHLKQFQEAAQQNINVGRVKAMEFAGNTYQVQVMDPVTEDDYWAFIQLDENGQIKDSFCSCKQGDEESGCIHVATGFLRIYNMNSDPLHVRFEKSIWNILGRVFADRLGYSPDIITKLGPGQYIQTSLSGKTVFSIKGKTYEARVYLKKIIEERDNETEETSLKFSNLSPEDLSLWREGHPPPHLRYELSFWHDIAQWLMILQDSGKEYTITFDHSRRNIPNFMNVSFEELEVLFFLSEANLPLIIPALATIKSPLKINDLAQNNLEKIHYDKKTATFLLEAKEGVKSQKKQLPTFGYDVGEWLYVSNDGFYTKDAHHLFETESLSGDQISQVLSEHKKLIQSLLDNATIHDEVIELSYTLSFDAHWNLHITAFAFSPGDLSMPYSHKFGDWIYLEDDGFYRVDNIRFDDIETVIPSKNVSDFVRQERSWLNTQEGFRTHPSSIESQLTYKVDDEGRLHILRAMEILDSSDNSKDFGSWIYVAKQGFYAKIGATAGLHLRPGLTIPRHQVSLFIRINWSELESIPDFFAKNCPVEKMKLSIHLLKNSELSITPIYQVLPRYEDKELYFYDDYVFIKGGGFYKLPIDYHLEEKYRHAAIIDDESAKVTFLTQEIDELEPWIVDLDPRLEKPDELHLIARKIDHAEDYGKGWYSLQLIYQSEIGAIPISALFTHFKQKKRFVFSDAGLIDLEDKRYKWIKQIAKGRIDRKTNVLILSTLELIRLNALEEIQVAEGEYLSKELLNELTDLHIPEDPDLEGLSSVLRPYQQLGVNWLWFLYTHELSGLLCDEMGLGKTHQAMALFAAISNFNRKFENKRKPHFLVVCPTSVLFHWQEKLQQFLPGVNICVYYGGDRSLDDFGEKYHVLLTSYGIWRLENNSLKNIAFDVAVFDEIQIAKNHQSRIHASLLTVKSRVRLGLTGTPIENRLRELKALFDIVLPGYMPADSDFRELFVKPIERGDDVSKKHLLTRFIKPFILRRKKVDVLLDLPEKTEEIAHCCLTPTQQMYYTDILQKSRQKLVEQLQDESSSIPYMHIFAVLSSLKQICDHPAVFLKTPEAFREYDSGKWELFVELLNEARDSQQKVVVFTQYLAMLDIFEEYLNEMEIGFSTIRGSTINRAEQITRFNKDPTCEIFLGSLQAAGLGVDLTAGSVVIHYDRWWNAARENQATDRVHRIGQTRGVQVFKLVTKGTFEEKIDDLITKKSKLMEEVVEIDDHRIIKQFDRQELIALLQDIEGNDE